MKRISLFFSFAFFMVYSTIQAQIVTYPNGKIAINTSSTPLSDIAINSTGLEKFYFFLQAPKSAMSCRTTGTNVSDWRYAGEFSNYATGSAFLVGLRGDVHPENNAEGTSGRAYGVYGAAGYATNGWNFGVFGRISGTHNGTGIYGSSNSSDNGIYIDGRYAGYFNGATKVAGSLTVTGKISGTVLSQAVKTSDAVTINTYANEKSNLEKLASLNAVSYYWEQPVATQAQEGDTIATTPELTDIEIQNYEKPHFALPVEQLEEAYPNLVYINEDGSKSVNYIELIPILVHSINELKAEINSLKKTTNAIANSANNQESLSVNLDGKAIGTKILKVTRK